MDRTTTHHNRTQQCHHCKILLSRIPQPRSDTQALALETEFFQNHSRPETSGGPCCFPILCILPSWPLTLTCLHPAVHQLPPLQPLLVPLSKYFCGAPRPLPRICAHGVWGIQGRAAWGRHKPGSILARARRPIRHKPGVVGTSRRHRLCPEPPQVETLQQSYQKLNQAKTALRLRRPGLKETGSALLRHQHLGRREG